MLRSTRIWLVQSLSASRLLAALLFSSLAFSNAPVVVPAILYFLAMASDLADGFIARKFLAETYFGKVVNLIGDKALTIVSLLFAAASGVDTLPLAAIAIREVVMLGMRLITVEGAQLLPTSRIFGGLMALMLWSNTLFLVLAHKDVRLSKAANSLYWICAAIFTSNLFARVFRSAHRIRVSSTRD